MLVTIPDEVPKAAHISEPELKQELAPALFQQERLTWRKRAVWLEWANSLFGH